MNPEMAEEVVDGSTTTSVPIMSNPEPEKQKEQATIQPDEAGDAAPKEQLSIQPGEGGDTAPKEQRSPPASRGKDTEEKNAEEPSPVEKIATAIETRKSSETATEQKEDAPAIDETSTITKIPLSSSEVANSASGK